MAGMTLLEDAGRSATHFLPGGATSGVAGAVTICAGVGVTEAYAPAAPSGVTGVAGVVTTCAGVGVTDGKPTG